MNKATDWLRSNHQVDADGVFVCVSRQAVVEALAEYEELLKLLKASVENIQGIADGTDIPSTAIRDLARAAISKAEGAP